jgi:ABC-type dipeptide/oligopeptide/nickel transport system permease component
MLTYILRRLLYSIPVLIAASFLTFTFVVLTADPLQNLKGSVRADQTQIARITHRYHLDEPVVVQYGYWFKQAATHKLGNTLVGNTPIWPDLQRVLGHTLQLLLLAEIFALVFGVALGVYSAIRQYSLFDYTTTTLSFVGLAMPIFWLALMLQVLVTNAYLKWDIRIFYTAGLSSSDPGTGINFLVDRLQHLALPAFCIAVVNLATYSRFMRSSMLEVVNSDYVRTARAKGLKERRVVMRHAFRNALIPIITLVGLNFGALFGGAIVTETIFSLDGMGAYFIRALADGDPYRIQAWLMVSATMIIIGNLFADILYGYLDPRIRYD